MSVLLEIREKIKSIYSKNDVFILPVVKFLLAYLVLHVLNDRMGYMTRLDSTAIVLIVALMCSFLPTGSIVLFAAVFSVLHMYALALEVAVVGLIAYMLIFLLFIRFGPKDVLVVALTPLLCAWKIPYIMPIAMGLLGTPVSALSVGCGVIVYYLLYEVVTNAPAVNALDPDDAIAKVRLLVDAILHNKVMLVTAAAFAITVIVVYLIRRMSVDHSWTIAMITGVMVNLMILLVGDLIYETNMSIGGAIWGNLLALGVAKVIEFFRFCVDYSRTERVQFEDDEYYYYVKAIPKMTVAAPTRTVKRINTQRRSSSSVSRSAVTERTRRNAPERERIQPRRGQSVTIGDSSEESNEDYEELY